MKKKLLTTGLIAGAAAVAGALIYKYTREQIIFSCDRWDIDINKRFRMADNLIKSGALGHPEVLFLKKGTYDDYREVLRKRGANLNQVKPIKVIDTDEKRDFFFAHVEE